MITITHLVIPPWGIQVKPYLHCHKVFEFPKEIFKHANSRVVLSKEFKDFTSQILNLEWNAQDVKIDLIQDFTLSSDLSSIKARLSLPTTLSSLCEIVINFPGKNKIPLLEENEIPRDSVDPLFSKSSYYKWREDIESWRSKKLEFFINSMKTNETYRIIRNILTDNAPDQPFEQIIIENEKENFTKDSDDDELTYYY